MKPYIADPNKYKRMTVGLRYADKIICKDYLRRLNLRTENELKVWRNELELQFANRDTTWLTRLFGQIWYNLLLPNVEKHLTAKQIFSLLSKTDQLIKYLPASKWVYILKAIDWIADLVYESME